MQPKISDMSDALQLKFAAFSAKMAEARIPFGLNEVLRNKETQLAYAAQGRTLEELIHMCLKFNWTVSADFLKQYGGMSPQKICDLLRGRANLPPLNGKEWYQITWTLNSKHFANKDGKSDAFDIKLYINGTTPTWDSKWDRDKDGVPEYREAALIGKAVGLDAGALWKKPDSPHYQLMGV